VIQITVDCGILNKSKKPYSIMTTRSGIAGLIIGVIAGFFVGLFINYQTYQTTLGPYGYGNVTDIGELITGSKYYTLLGSSPFPTTIFMFVLIFGIIGFGVGYLIRKK